MNRDHFTRLDSIDPIPALGRKVEKPLPITADEQKQLDALVFERMSDAPKTAPWPFPTGLKAPEWSNRVCINGLVWLEL